MENYIGISYMDYDYTNCEVVAMRKNGEYLIKDSVHTGANGCYSIRSSEDIDNMLNLQEKLLESCKRSLERRKQEEDREEKERQLQAEKENLYGFTDNKSPMQQGKILKSLMASIVYNNKVITRKEFVMTLIKEDYIPNIKTYTNWKTEKKKTDYVLEKESFYTITKTEYDFANYYKGIV